MSKQEPIQQSRRQALVALGAVTASVGGASCVAEGPTVSQLGTRRQETTTSEIIDVTDSTYGGVANSSTDNYQAFKDAIADAITASRPLYVPSPGDGKYYWIDFENPDGGTRGAYDITDDLRIIGDGVGDTVIKVGPNSPAQRTTDVRMFTVQEGKDLSLEAVEIHGPATPCDSCVPTFTKETFCVWHEGGGGELRVRASKLHNWFQTITVVADANADSGHVYIESSTVTAKGNCYNHKDPSANGSTFCSNSTFELVSAGGDDGFHCVYIAHGLSGRFVSCSFNYAPGWGIKWQLGQTSDDAASEVLVADCTFGSSLKAGGIQLPNPDAGAPRAKIMGCSFEQTTGDDDDSPAIFIAKGGADIYNCSFTGGGPATSGAGQGRVFHAPGTDDVYFSDCTFGGSPQSVHKTENNGPGEGSTVRFDRCLFEIASSDSTNGSVIRMLAHDSTVECYECDFESTSLQWATIMDGGTLRLRFCRFPGNDSTTSDGVVYARAFASPHTASVLEVDACEWSSPAGTAEEDVRIQKLAGVAGTLAGARSTFVGGGDTTTHTGAAWNGSLAGSKGGSSYTFTVT